MMINGCYKTETDRHYVLLTEVIVITYEASLVYLLQKKEKSHLNLIKPLDLTTYLYDIQGTEENRNHHKDPINKIQMGKFTELTTFFILPNK